MNSNRNRWRIGGAAGCPKSGSVWLFFGIVKRLGTPFGIFWRVVFYFMPEIKLLGMCLGYSLESWTLSELVISKFRELDIQANIQKPR